MIRSVGYTSATSASVAITMDDGSIWYDDASLPADTEIRRRLAAWRAAPGNVIAAYVAPDPPPPPIITRRQFAAEARNRGIITQAEALSFVARGEIPAALQAAVDTLAAGPSHDDAMLSLAGAAEFHIDHPLTAMIGAAFAGAMPPAEFIAGFFRAAAAL